VKPFFPHILSILFTSSRQRITLPKLHDFPLDLRSTPATRELEAALAVESQTKNQYLLRVHAPFLFPFPYSYESNSS
jgi:hypothetical protein